jgi:ADP-ribosylation factor GTPase-activating protein 1
MCTTSTSVAASEHESLVASAAQELEELRKLPAHEGAKFGIACCKLLQALPGNLSCVDCGSPSPDWASVSFGSLICLQCSGRHRSYGVHASTVRSVSMDSWSHIQVLSMLEGGNQQLKTFFDRHQMGDIPTKRYQTKAARFYRTNLFKHVEDVAAKGLYKGREESRRKAPRRTCSQQVPRDTDSRSETKADQPLSVQ